MVIDLGDVGVIATIRINGKLAGTLWMNPWRLQPGNLLKVGDNFIEIEVANLWRNRMILDSKLPNDLRYTWTVVSDAQPDEIPPPSGLLGPVKISIYR